MCLGQSANKEYIANASETLPPQLTSNLNTDLFIYGDIRKPSFIERWYGEDESRVDALTFAKALEEVDTPNLTTCNYF